MPVPRSIREAPTLLMGNELFYLGFMDLTSCRSIGMALGPISLLSILEYCKIHEIVGDQREDFVWVIQKLDHFYIKWVSEKNGRS